MQLRALTVAVVAAGAWGCGGVEPATHGAFVETPVVIAQDVHAAPVRTDAFEVFGLQVAVFEGFPNGRIELHIETWDTPLVVTGGEPPYWTIALPHAQFGSLRDVAWAVIRQYGFNVEGREVRFSSSLDDTGRTRWTLRIDGFEHPIEVVEHVPGSFLIQGLPHHVFPSLKDAAASFVKFFGSEAAPVTP